VGVAWVVLGIALTPIQLMKVVKAYCGA